MERPPLHHREVRWTGNQVLGTRAPEALAVKSGALRPVLASKSHGDAYPRIRRGLPLRGREPRETCSFAVDVRSLCRKDRLRTSLPPTGRQHGTREKSCGARSRATGNRFKRSALVRPRGDVFRRFFYECDRLRSRRRTDVDATLKVKEKQVDRSAGAVPAESGLTGFSSSLTTCSERPDPLAPPRARCRARYYSASPTLVPRTPTYGLLAFIPIASSISTLESSGGSVASASPAVARLLARLGLLQLEVCASLDPPCDPPNLAHDSLILAGGATRAVLTSSISPFFLLTSANILLSARRQPLSIETEWLESLRGSVNFQHRIGRRTYFLPPQRGPPWSGGAWILASTQPKPPRPITSASIGGGTTPDPLRGYDDYWCPGQSPDVLNITSKIKDRPTGQCR